MQHLSQATSVIHWLSDSSESLMSVIRVGLIDMTSLPPCVRLGEAVVHAPVGGLSNVIKREESQRSR